MGENKHANMNVIIELLNTNKSISANQAAEFIGASPATIRRYFNTISKEHKENIRREHGKLFLVEPVEEEITSLKGQSNRQEKKIIANLARQFVVDESQIIIDSGTTCAEFAKTLKDAKANVICSDIKTSAMLSDFDGISLFVLGGAVRTRFHSIIGDMACGNLNNFIADTLFMSCDALCPVHGITNVGIEEVAVKKASISRSKKVVLLVDSSKLMSQTNFSVAKLSSVNIIVCDSDLPKDLADVARELSITVVTPNTEVKK